MLGNDHIDGHEPGLLVLEERRRDIVSANQCPSWIILSADLLVVASAQHCKCSGLPGLRDVDIDHDPAGAAAIWSGEVRNIGLVGVLRLIGEDDIATNI